MKKIGLSTFVLLLFSFYDSAAAELLIIANIDKDNAVNNNKSVNVVVNKRDVRDIFMGNNTDLKLIPVALAPNHKARDIFNTKIVGLTESRIQSYWAQMRFSGRKKPPREFNSVAEMLEFVENNHNTVAYVPSNTEVPEQLTIIYQLD